MRIAIMQPYFIPYAGYFRLFSAVDVFVIYDCVQFLRRGWMHRNRLYNAKRELDWLTLPLQKAPQDVLLNNINFVSDAATVWPDRLRAFPSLANANPDVLPLLDQITNINATPVDFITNTLRGTCELLKLPFNTIKSSSLNISPELRGQDRIIEIAKQVGAKQYINLSGGRSLYDASHFTKHNLDLQFLQDYQGPMESILQRLLEADAKSIKTEITGQLTLS